MEFAGGFSGDDVDGAVLPVEGIPAEGEDVAEALAVCAEAAADGGGPFVGEFGEEEADFVEGEGERGREESIGYNYFYEYEND